MKYIFMVAGKGTRLQPLTLKHPKSLYKLDEETTLLQRMVALIKKHDAEADIVIVTGHMHRAVEEQVTGVTFIYNPFYEVTNSIASLWFAREHLDADNVVLIDGDIVMSDELVEKVMCRPVEKAYVLVDSSIKTDGDYNVEVSGDQVLVMSKDLTSYYGEYAGVSKLDRESALLMRGELESMIEQGFYDQWYENALVQLIFKNDFRLYYTDISNYEWTEVDSVNDLLTAKQIHLKEK
ncbi:MAG: phosphocholine cytidylyltransferase family protein [Lachnospiraceae bacterium]|nr:phosphocholine cytidylyltransferase family protein [Lachnospiraceae bacterium]